MQLWQNWEAVKVEEYVLCFIIYLCIMGCINGLTCRNFTLTKFFLATPDSARHSNEADTVVGLCATNVNYHHQLGSFDK